MTKSIKELFLKSSSFFLIKVFGFLSGYLFTLFVARAYGAEINGLVALSFSIFLIGSLIPRFGFDIHLVKTFSSNTIEASKSIYFRVLAIAISIAFICSFIGITFKDFFIELIGITDSQYAIIGFLSIPIWVVIVINAAVLRGLKQIKAFSFLTNAGRFIFALIFLLGAFYILDEKSNIVPIYAHFIGLIVLMLYSIFKVMKSFKRSPKSKRLIKTKQYLRESYPLLFSSALILLLGWTDTIFLGVYTSSEEVGVYHVVLKLAAVVGFSLQSLNSILAPKIAKLYKEDKTQEFKKLLSLVVKVNFFFSIAIIIFLVIFRVFVLGLFGEEFIAGSDVLLILCIGQFSNAFCGPVGLVFQMTGKQKIFQNLVFIAFLINLTLNVFLIKPLGYYGAAISSVVSMAFWNFLGVYIIKRKYDILLAYLPVLNKK